MPNLGTVNTTTSIATSAELAADIATHAGAADPHTGYALEAALGSMAPLNNPMTTAADLIVGGASGALARLAKGSDGQVLTVDPTTHLLVWATPSGGGTFATPAIVLGTAAAEGAASTGIRSDATLLAFDATAPAAIGTAAVGAATVAGRRDHVHATGAGTPSTQAFGDAAATGSGPAAAMTDHKHAMPASPGAGALVLLEQQTASASATLDFTAFISATYDEYLFELLDVLPATNHSQLYMRVRSGGSFISTSKYQTSAWVWVYNGQTATGNAIGALVGQITTSNANDQWNGAGAAAGTVGQVRLFNPQSTGAYKRITYEIGFHESGTGMMKGSSGRAIYADTAAIDGFRFLFNSGNIASGTIRVYGIAKT